ncbi:ATP-dependent nuclease [Halomonas sp. WWR20]
MRGLTGFKISLNYPITAIAGKNGSGKSTLLALACCAYHNSRTGYKLPSRRQNYYTFADFFIQHNEDIPPEGIMISYGIAYDKWRKTENIPDGVGIAFQTRRKNKGGKWNDYSKRVRREVVFLGIERIVPHNEKSQSKSYSRYFSAKGGEGWEHQVKEQVGKILGKRYDDFRFVTHSKYRLPIVSCKGAIYSGFNMGAGENALFEVLSIMHSVSEGSLVVIDEIELGLHAEAQRKFILCLKDLCKVRKLQVICTTHSRHIFDELPDDARFFVDNVNGKTIITDSISPDYAFSKLISKSSNELTALVEDKVAKAMLMAALPGNLRSRVAVEIIGSAPALSRQLAANYMREKRDHITVVYDGDQRFLERKNIEHALSMAEPKDKEDFEEWMREKILYLPGDTWPESWVVQKCLEDINEVSTLFGIEEDEMSDILERGLEAGKHKEINDIGGLVGLDEKEVLSRLCLCVVKSHEEQFENLIDEFSARVG